MSIEERRALRIRNYQKYRSYADAKGVSDYQVSKEVGFHNVVLSEWKSGKCQPKYDKLLLIANYLGTTVDALISG